MSSTRTTATVKKVAAGIWLPITPDGEIQQHDLSWTTTRSSSATEYTRRRSVLTLKRMAEMQATLVGDDPVAEVDVNVWVVSEPGRIHLGVPLPEVELVDAMLGWANGLRALDGARHVALRDAVPLLRESAFEAIGGSPGRGPCWSGSRPSATRPPRRLCVGFRSPANMAKMISR